MNITAFYILAGLILAGVALFMNWNRLSLYLRKRFGKITEAELAEMNEPEQAEEKKDQKPISEPVYARVYDNLRRAIYNDTLQGSVVDEIKEKYKTLGRRWNRDGQEVYAVCKTVDEEYIPVATYMISTRENPPSRLHGALNQPYTGIAFNVKVQGNFMRKWGSILLFAGFGVFVMMLIVLN